MRFVLFGDYRNCDSGASPRRLIVRASIQHYDEPAETREGQPRPVGYAQISHGDRRKAREYRAEAQNPRQYQQPTYF